MQGDPLVLQQLLDTGAVRGVTLQAPGDEGAALLTHLAGVAHLRGGGNMQDGGDGWGTQTQQGQACEIS